MLKEKVTWYIINLSQTTNAHWTDKTFSFKTTRSQTFRFNNGEFAMIGLMIDDKPLLRAYSIASANYEDELEFLSIKVSDGSLQVHPQHLKVGDEVIVMPKCTGILTIDNLTQADNLYLRPTGTGIAPIYEYYQRPCNI